MGVLYLAKDLTCLFLPEQKYLFSGDMYISKSLKYLRIDENLTQLIQSLRKLIALDFEILFCPHRGIVEEGKKALQKTKELHENLWKEMPDLGAYI